MKLLIDTHVLLWYIADDPRLSQTARELVESEQSELLLSVASAWEIILKAQRGKLKLSEPPPQFVRRHIRVLGLRVLPLRLRHVLDMHDLPPLHSDPVDRMLVAQARVDQIPLLTSNHLVQQYPLQTIW